MPSPAVQDALAGLEIQDDERSVYTQVAQHLHQGKEGVPVPAGVVNLGFKWMAETSKLTAPRGLEQAAHSYKVSDGYGFTAEDQPNLVHFLNHMHGAHASQAEIDAMLGMYVRLRDAHAGGPDPTLDARDRADFARARKILGPDWKPASGRFVALYVESLPPEKRAQVENAADLFTPQKLRELERAGRALVGRRDGPYWKGPRAQELQAAFADMIAKQEGGTARGNGSPSGEAQELATLRGMMGNRSSPYWKGKDAERNQARYRALVAKGHR